MTNPIWLIKTRLQLQQKLLDAPTVAAGGASMTAAAATAAATARSSSGALASSSSSPLLAQQVQHTAQQAAQQANQAAQQSAQHAQQAAAQQASRPYRGLFDAILRIGREEGLRGYYKGLAPSLMLVRGLGRGLEVGSGGRGS